MRRVRAINFCVQAGPECFVLFLGPNTDQPVPIFNVIEDCIVEKPGENNTHETSPLANVGNAYGSARSPIVRHNYVNCSYVKADGSTASTEYVAVASLTAPQNNEFTLTTKRPHNRAAGQNILLNNVLMAGSSPPAGHPYFNRSFRIKALDSMTPLTKMTCEFISPPTPPTAHDASQAYIGVSFQGLGASSGTGCVTEGNALYDSLRAFYTDTGSTRDAVVRDNYYSKIRSGLEIDFNPLAAGVGAAQAAKSLTRSVVNGKFIATFKIADGTPLVQVAVDDAVTVTGARVGNQPAPDNTYNGTFSVVSVSSDRREFSYEMKNDPLVDADSPAAVPRLSRLLYWQQGVPHPEF